MRYLQHPDYTADFVNSFYLALCEGHTLHSASWFCGVPYRLVKEWRKTYPEFNQKVCDGLDFAQGWYDQKAKDNLENAKFNTNLYMLVRRARWNDSDEGRVKLEGFGDIDANFAEKTRIVRDAVASGRIGTRQSKELIDLLTGEAKILEVEDLKKRIELLEKNLGVDEDES